MPATRRGARKPLDPQADQRSTSQAAASGSIAKRPRRSAGMLQIRVADSLKAEAEVTLQAIGFTTSEAVRLFLQRVVAEQRLPLDLEVPNVVTRAAIQEARDMVHRTRRFATPEEMFESLEDSSER